MVGVSFLLAAWGPLYTYVFGVVGLTSAEMVTPLVATCMAGTSLLMRKTGSVRVASNWLAGQLYFIIAVVLYEAGGLQTTAISWALVVPLFAMMAADVRDALAWFGVLLLTYVGFAAAESAAVLPPSHVVPRWRLGFDLVLIIGATAVLVSISWYAERQRSQTHAALDAERVRAEQARQAARRILDNVHEGLVIVDAQGAVQPGHSALQLEYQPLFEDEVLTSVLVSLVDVTAQRQAARVEALQRDVDRIVDRYVQDPAGVLEFLRETRGLLQGLTAFSDAPLARALHTLKGNAGLVGLHFLSDQVHVAESALLEGVDWDRDELVSMFEELYRRVGPLFRLDEEPGIRLPRQVLETWDAHLAVPELAPVRAALAEHLTEPVAVRLQRLADGGRALAERLGTSTTVACGSTRIAPTRSGRASFTWCATAWTTDWTRKAAPCSCVPTQPSAPGCSRWATTARASTGSASPARPGRRGCPQTPTTSAWRRCSRMG